MHAHALQILSVSETLHIFILSTKDFMHKAIMFITTHDLLCDKYNNNAFKKHNLPNDIMNTNNSHCYILV